MLTTMKAARRSNKTRTNKANYMSDDAFADLKEAVEDALAFERGERRNLNVTRIQAPGSPKDKMEAIEGISRGLERIKRKAGKPADKFFQEFFADNSIPEHD
jgi:hypothetical protein